MPPGTVKWTELYCLNSNWFQIIRCPILLPMTVQPMTTENMSLLSRVHDTYIEGVQTFQYYACQSTMISHSADTCTSSCKHCLAGLAEYEGKGQIIKEGSSNWGCEGYSCMAISQGCTCAVCTHRPNGQCHGVFKVEEPTTVVEICFVLDVRAVC